METILIEVDKVFLAWKVELFTQILLFFFYEEEAGDAPSPVAPTATRKQLQLIIRFQQFTFYAYFDQQLFALGNLFLISFRYAQDTLEESYHLDCKIVEMDKYIGGDRNKKLPMIKRRL